MENKIRIVVLASGSGTTFEYFSKDKGIEVLSLITNKTNCMALKQAKKLSIPSFVVDPAQYSSFDEWDQALTKIVKQFSNTHLIVLAGFLNRVGKVFLKAFKDKVVNSHPSLLPRFGGKGMYGIHVHRAVCEAQEKITGITIHYVNEEYDKGRIIAQKKIDVLPTDTPESLEERVKKEEKSFYAQTIKQLFL